MLFISGIQRNARAGVDLAGAPARAFCINIIVMIVRHHHTTILTSKFLLFQHQYMKYIYFSCVVETLAKKFFLAHCTVLYIFFFFFFNLVLSLTTLRYRYTCASVIFIWFFIYFEASDSAPRVGLTMLALSPDLRLP